MPNKLFAQNLQKKIQNRKMIITIEFYIFEIGIKFQCKLKGQSKLSNGKSVYLRETSFYQTIRANEKKVNGNKSGPDGIVGEST